MQRRRQCPWWTARCTTCRSKPANRACSELISHLAPSLPCSWEVIDMALQEIVETGGDMDEYKQVGAAGCSGCSASRCSSSSSSGSCSGL